MPVIPPAVAVAALLIIGSGVPIGMMLVNRVLHPPVAGNPAKRLPYECGLPAMVGDASAPIGVRFYLVAVAFLVLDVEVALLYPWAAQAGTGTWAGIGLLLAVLTVLECGWLYLWRRGALDVTRG